MAGTGAGAWAIVPRLTPIALPIWFVTMFAWHAVTYRFWDLLGVDVRIYHRAAVLWLAGGDPWSVVVNGFAFAAPPPTLLLFAPLTIVSEEAAIAFLLPTVALAGLWCVRRLGLPWWWILFPPLLEAITVGSIQPIVLGLLLAGSGDVAVFAKAFAATPLIIQGRWRELVGAAMLAVVTAPLLPWSPFLADAELIAERAALTSTPPGTSIWTVPLLAVPVILALLVAGRARLPWLSVPILWPVQINYSVLALPAMTPGLAFLFAIPTRSAPAVGLIAWAIIGLLLARLRRPRP